METKTAGETTITVPPAVRCDNCGALAREEVRERTNDEVVVRYACPECRHQQTRRYGREELNQDAD